MLPFHAPDELLSCWHFRRRFRQHAAADG